MPISPQKILDKLSIEDQQIVDTMDRLLETVLTSRFTGDSVVVTPSEISPPNTHVSERHLELVFNRYRQCGWAIFKTEFEDCDFRREPYIVTAYQFKSRSVETLADKLAAYANRQDFS